MTLRTDLMWSVVGGRLKTNQLVSSANTVKVLISTMPKKVTLAVSPGNGEIGVDEEIFGDTDDGLDTQRALLLKYYVAAAALEFTPNRDARYQATYYIQRAQAIEREMYGALERMQGSHTVAGNRGMKMDDIG